MITGQDIICISSIDWDFSWQSHQEIMTRLAVHGNRVLFVENTGVRTFRVGDIPRVRSRIRNWWRGTKGFREERQNLFVFSPVFLPFPYSGVARWINRTMLLRALRRWMRAADFQSPLVWTFLPTPLALDLIRELDPALTIYYCADNFASSSRAARKITKTEDEVFREADLVFVTSEGLRERAARLNQHVHVFNSGVNYEAFEQARLSADGVPDDLRALPRPVLGYVGGLHQALDQNLVNRLSEAMPEASLALIGPPVVDVTALQGRHNVHLLGARPHADLPRYIKGFDVALIPYVSSEYTTHVFPSKLNEYLAMGVPVVATDIPEIRRFNAAHGDVVAAPAADAFVAAVREALRVAGPGEIERRLQVAKDNGWSSRLREMSVLINQSLTARDRSAAGWKTRLGRLYRKARVRSLEVAAVLAVYILFFYTPALWLIAAPLHMAATPEPADAIVVLGGGVGESGQAGGSFQERVKEAVDLYKAGFARPMVFSSGFVYAFKEAEIMSALAVSQGVRPSDIVLETRAGSTRENALFVQEIGARYGWRRILLVSSPYHMRRATLAWRKVAPDVTVIPTPATTSQFYDHHLGASLKQIRGIGHEYAALAYYWLKGWV